MPFEKLQFIIIPRLNVSVWIDGYADIKGPLQDHSNGSGYGIRYQIMKIGYLFLILRLKLRNFYFLSYGSCEPF